MLSNLVHLGPLLCYVFRAWRRRRSTELILRLRRISEQMFRKTVNKTSKSKVKKFENEIQKQKLTLKLKIQSSVLQKKCSKDIL